MDLLTVCTNSNHRYFIQKRSEFDVGALIIIAEDSNYFNLNQRKI